MQEYLFTRVILIIFLLFPFAVLGGPGPNEIQNNSAQVVSMHPKWKTAEVIETNYTSSRLSSIEDKAIEFLVAKKTHTRISSPSTELKHFQTNRDNLNFSHVRFQQQFNKIPIWGCETIVHFDADEIIYLLGGQTIATPDISTIPTLSSSSAEQTVLNELQDKLNQEYDLKKSELTIYPDNNTPKLCWQVVIEDFESVPPARWRCLVDANTGEILLIYNDIPSDGPAVGVGDDVLGVERTFGTYEFGGTYKMADASLPMFTPPIDNFDGVITSHLGNYSLNNPFANFGPGNTWNYHWLEEAIVSSQANLTVAYNYFYDTFGRNSWDDNNSSVHGIAYATGISNNAFWLGNGQVTFGSGDTVRYLPWSGADDIVVHEFTHGVTQTTANLTYLFQSGALNEHYSDFFGAMADRDDWTIAEDINISPEDFLRSMEDPHLGAIPDLYPFGYQPAHMSEYVDVSASNDNGGVHSNSGIPNRVAFLVGSVIGKDKAELIWYRTLTTYLTPNSSFHFWGQMTGQSIIDLYGVDSPELDALNAALDSVGIYQPFADPNPFSISAKFDTESSEELIIYSGLTDTLTIDSVIIISGLVSINGIYPVTIMNGETFPIDVTFDATSYLSCDVGNYYDTLEIYNSSSTSPLIIVPINLLVSISDIGKRTWGFYDGDCNSNNNVDLNVHNTGSMSNLPRSNQDGLYISTLLIGLIDGVDTTVYKDTYGYVSFIPSEGMFDSTNSRTGYRSLYTEIFTDQSRVVGTAEYFYYSPNQFQSGGTHCGEIIVEYTLTNTCDTTLNIVVGIFADFDLDNADFNLVGLDEANNIGYVTSLTNSRAVGIVPIGSTPRNMRVVHNQAEIWPTANLPEGFAYREMMETSNNTGTPGLEADWSIILTYETATLAPGDTLKYSAAFLHSDIGSSDLINMFNNIDTYKDSAYLFLDTNNISVFNRIGQPTSDTTISISLTNFYEEPSASWEASHDSSWLILSDYSGMTDQLVTLSFDITGMEPGIYLDSIRFSSPSASNPPVYTKIELLIHPSGNVINVPQTFIQEIGVAARIALDGDTILVGPGEYYEAINIHNSSCVLKSTDGPLVTRILSKYFWTDNTIEIKNKSHGKVEISGFTFSNIGINQSTIIVGHTDNTDSILIHDNIFDETEKTLSLASRNTYIKIYNNLFLNGNTHNQNSVIDVSPENVNAEITNNIFYNNRRCISAKNGGSVYVRKNIFVNSLYGVYGENADSDCNLFWGNNRNYDAPATPGPNDITADPLFCYPGIMNFNVDPSSPVLAINNACSLLIGIPSIVAEDCGILCVLRGDMDHDGELNISDLTYFVSFMFKGGSAPVSVEEGDVDSDSEINISDLTFMVNFMFKSGEAPAPCSK